MKDTKLKQVLADFEKRISKIEEVFGRKGEIKEITIIPKVEKIECKEEKFLPEPTLLKEEMVLNTEDIVEAKKQLKKNGTNSKSKEEKED